MFDTFGNTVRIKRTPETLEKALADKVGEIYGQTIPSIMDIELLEPQSRLCNKRVFKKACKEL